MLKGITDPEKRKILEKDLLTNSEVIKILGGSPNRIRGLISLGYLKVGRQLLKSGRKWITKKSVVETYKKENFL